MPELVDLRKVELHQLEPLLDEEIAEWDQVLDWDFTQNARLIRRYAAQQALPGVALMDRGEVAGYGYTVLDFPKGLIGDVYLRAGWRGVDSEVRLFKVLLDALTGTEGIERIESQLMLVPPEIIGTLTGDRFVRLFERRLLSRELRLPIWPAAEETEGRYRFAGWDSGALNSLPRLIVRCYEGHIDSQINDQYTSVSGAATFLDALLDNAGCGEFFRPGAVFAIDRRTEWMSGAILTSLVTRDTAHVTQFCVAPEAQSAGLGRELLRRCLESLAERGIRRVSLAVTASNVRANRIYDQAGFTELRRFCAIVWNAMSHSNFR